MSYMRVKVFENITNLTLGRKLQTYQNFIGLFLSCDFFTILILSPYCVTISNPTEGFFKAVDYPRSFILEHCLSLKPAHKRGYFMSKSDYQSIQRSWVQIPLRTNYSKISQNTFLKLCRNISLYHCSSSMNEDTL